MVSFTETFESTVPANPGVLFRFRHSLRDWLQAAELESGAADALVLAVHEAVANGIEHGSCSRVLVEGRAGNGDLFVEITTRGSWKAESESEWDGALAERGRGLALIDALTELELLVHDGCVTIRLRPSQT